MAYNQAYPQLLWLLAIIPLATGWYWWQFSNQKVALKLSSSAELPENKFISIATLQHLLFALRMIACVFIILALSRPQLPYSIKTVNSEGIDIMLALDVSGSMLQEDFKPNRLEAAKQVADTFIAKRPNDRIGLLLFASEAYTGCPITIDHNALRRVLAGVGAGDVSGGTAIGNGLGSAVNRLQASKGETKVVILMTDGENNAGNIKPMEAAKLAKALNIRVYTIGIEITPAKVDTVAQELGLSPNGEYLLQQIAGMTNGKYFRAMDEKALASIYRQIDTMEKTKVDVSVYQQQEEYFYPLALIAALAILLEVLLRYTVLKTLP